MTGSEPSGRRRWRNPRILGALLAASAVVVVAVTP